MGGEWGLLIASYLPGVWSYEVFVKICPCCSYAAYNNTGVHIM